MRNIIKIFLLIILFRLFLSSSFAQEENQSASILIINQLRGNEICCQSGNKDMIEKIDSDERLKTLDIGWALRYDVLKDNDFTASVSALPKNQTLGILLEITPNLASDSSVIYKGKADGSDWYNARNAFLIGYSVAERQKLIDTVFAKFHEKFQYYPTFTVAWMIDSWSLNYIFNTYGVRVHELTKEQYETDSYTLYGGIFNLPYFPSQNHPFVPAQNSGDKLDILMIRQTISDIETNYGSALSYFTSQPNDYLSNPQSGGFNYFTQLIESIFNQSQPDQFAVLGLENSDYIWKNYGDEYLKQLNFIYDKQQEGKLKILSPIAYYHQFNGQNKTNPEFVLKSAAFPQSGIMWYFGKKYRARLEIWNGKLVLTDVRIFTDFSDPYKDNPTEANRAYWIIPYLLDSSQQFFDIKLQDIHKGFSIRNDLSAQRFGIQLTDKKITSVDCQENCVLKTDTEAIELTPDLLQLSAGLNPKLLDPISLDAESIIATSTENYYEFLRHPRFFITSNSQKQEFEMGWETKDLEKIVMAKFIKNQGSFWQLLPNSDLKPVEIDKLSAIFQPDKSDSIFSQELSTFYWHNLEAIAGKSSVRLYIDPRNILGRNMALKNFMIKINGENVTANNTENIATKNEPFLIDFTASRSASAVIDLDVDGKMIASQTAIRFYSDCSLHLFSCLQNKDEAWGFIRVNLRDKWQAFLQQLQPQIIDIKNNLFSKFHL